MRKFRFQKLVRDKVVDGILNEGNKPDFKTLSEREYIKELKLKLLEEAKELPKAKNDNIIRELADIQEIIDNLIKALGLVQEQLKEAQEKKNELAGSFKKRHYIKDIKVQDNSERIKYYLQFPDKYPEIKD